MQIGGGKLADKATALDFLVSKCDGLAFVGSMAFQIMYALGVPVPMKLVETGALEDAARLVEFAKSRKIPLVLPQDVWCITDHVSGEMQIASVYSIPEGESLTYRLSLSFINVLLSLSVCDAHTIIKYDNSNQNLVV